MDGIAWHSQSARQPVKQISCRSNKNQFRLGTQSQDAERQRIDKTVEYNMYSMYV